MGTVQRKHPETGKWVDAEIVEELEAKGEEKDVDSDVPATAEEALEADYNAQIKYVSANDIETESRRKEDVRKALEALVSGDSE